MSNESSTPDFVTFTRELENYKWYKPLLTIILGFIIYIILTLVISIIIEGAPGINRAALTSTGYESMNATSIEGLSQLLYVITMIPAVWIASKITRDRPFSTYLTSGRKWNWSIFLKTFLIGAIVILAIDIIPGIIQGTKINIQFTIITLIMAIILVPLQCFAEELVFRGLFMQSFGSWFKIPIIAVILQAVLFMLGHPYNLLGQISILASGIAYGLIAWQMNGLEATSGLHSANNLVLFLSMGIFAVGPVATNVTLTTALADIGMVVVTAAITLGLYKKTNWLNPE